MEAIYKSMEITIRYDFGDMYNHAKEIQILRDGIKKAMLTKIAENIMYKDVFDKL
jgi:hypothetical protein